MNIKIPTLKWLLNHLRRLTLSKVDKSRFRATYGVSYPTNSAIIDRKQDESTVEDLDISISSTERKLTRIRFIRCRPQYNKAIGKAEVADLFFEECFFGSCFLGSVIYRGVRFNKCKFHRSDLMNSKFIDCEFSNCQFIDCTAWNVNFERSVVNPQEFISGIPFPTTNYSDFETPALEATIKKYVLTTLPVSRQLLHSASSLQHSEYADLALYHYKWELLKHRIYVLFNDWSKYQSFAKKRTEIFFGVCRDSFAIPFEWLNLVVTRGGTSLTRLLWVFGVLNFFIFPVSYGYFQIFNEKYRFEVADISYFKKIISSFELFFSFGYSDFSSAENAGRILMTGQPVLGLIWLAFLAPVLLRRAYR